MATFTQWFRNRPKDEETLQKLFFKTRMVWITGSRPAFVNYVYDWWCAGYKNIEETITLFADESDYWDQVFLSPISGRRVVRLLRAEDIKEKEYLRFRQFKEDKGLRKSHLIVREYQKEKIDTSLAKYRPFIDYWAGKYVNCQRSRPDDLVEFAQIELGLGRPAANYLVGHCGSQEAVLQTIKRCKLSSIVPNKTEHIKMFAVRSFENVLADLLLDKKKLDAFELVTHSKINTDFFIDVMASRLNQIAVFIYCMNRNIRSKRELVEKTKIPVWKLPEVQRRARGQTLKKLSRYVDLLRKFEHVKYQNGALVWLVGMWV